MTCTRQSWQVDPFFFLMLSLLRNWHVRYKCDSALSNFLNIILPCIFSSSIHHILVKFFCFPILYTTYTFFFIFAKVHFFGKFFFFAKVNSHIFTLTIDRVCTFFSFAYYFPLSWFFFFFHFPFTFCIILFLRLKIMRVEFWLSESPWIILKRPMNRIFCIIGERELSFHFLTHLDMKWDSTRTWIYDPVNNHS